VAEAAEVLVGL